MKLATAFVEVRPDTRGFKRELQQETTRDARAVASELGSVLAGGAFLVGAKRATDAASQLEQAVGGTTAVFGESADAVAAWSKDAAEAAGLSERAARELTSQIGGLLKGFGFAESEAAALSTQLAQLGADLAATFGGNPEDAVIALGAALRGETDPLERFGIALNQTLVNQRAVDLGLAASTSKVDQHAKAQATLALIMERSADAQGQFAREAESAAGQAAIAAAKAENASADLGENLLPIYTKIAEVVGLVADGFAALPEPVQTAVIALGAIVALSGPVKLAAEAISSMATIARTVLTKSLDAAATGAYTLAGNLGTATAALGALGAAVVVASMVWEENAKNAAAAEAATRGATDAIRDAGDAAEGTAAWVAQLAQDSPALSSVLDAAGVSSDQLATALRGTNEEYAAMRGRLEAAARAQGLGTEGILTATLGLDQLRVSAQEGAEQVDREGRVVGEAGDKAETAAGQIGGLNTALDVNEQAAKDAAESVKLWREAVEKALRPLDLQGAVDDRTQALLDMASEIDARRQDVADARAALATAREGGDPAEIARAQQELADAIAATSLSLEGNSEAAVRNREDLRSLVDDSIGVIEAAREQGKSLEELQVIRALEIQNLRDQLTQMGYNREEIETYIGVIEDIPITRETTVTFESAAAEAQIAAFARYAAAAFAAAGLGPDGVPLTPKGVDDVIAAYQKKKDSPFYGGGYAAGGVMGDGDWLVGEAGVAEVVRKRGESVEVIAGAAPTRLGASMSNYFTIVAPDVEHGMDAASKRLRRLALEMET